MPAPRRILVAVEPRLLGDTLSALLAEIGLDEVVRLGTEAATGHIDLALVNDGSPSVRADLVLRVPDSAELAVAGRGDLRPGSASELLAILDRVCPAGEPRRERLHDPSMSGGGHG
jgi:hypothetical protein